LSLNRWLETIAARHPKTIDLGLERVRRVASQMNFVQGEQGISLGCTSIIVGGTNGKGSTCGMLESILLRAGYRVATYTSPHLLRFNERLRINGEMVSDEQLIASFERVQAADCHGLRPRNDTSHHCEPAQAGVAIQSLTYFEFTTLAIFDIIRHASVDVAVLEIGLGGRLDAVNIVDADCSVLVSVAMDHQDYLGDTREKIGWEKAHIARKGRPFICADPEPPATVAQVATQIGADIWQLGVDFNYQGDRQQWSWAGRSLRRNALAYPALRGVNQLINASAALAALGALREQLAIPAASVREGLALVEVPGRFQVLPGQPCVVLDVAHNPHAAAVLAANLDQMGFFPKTIAVCGILADKDIEAILQKLGDRIDHWCFATLAGPDVGSRGTAAQMLYQKLRKAAPNATADCFDSPLDAFAAAKEGVQPSDRIVVFGSFLTVAQIMHASHAS
jgi:dihydrofolate synthase / folylpolyglutamate synthase